MTEPEQPPFEYELLRQATLAEIDVAKTQINSTSDGKDASSQKHKR